MDFKRLKGRPVTSRSASDPRYAEIRKLIDEMPIHHDIGHDSVDAFDQWEGLAFRSKQELDEARRAVVAYRTRSYRMGVEWFLHTRSGRSGETYTLWLLKTKQ